MLSSSSSVSYEKDDASMLYRLYRRWLKHMEHPYMPCFLVFLSGIGFSIQSLVVKLLEERTGFDGSFQLVFWRGFMQMLVSYAFIYNRGAEGDHVASCNEYVSFCIYFSKSV